MSNNLVEHCCFGMPMEVYPEEISFGAGELNKVIALPTAGDHIPVCRGPGQGERKTGN